MDRVKKYAKSAAMMIIIPLVTYIVFWILCKLNGVSGFGVGTDLTVMLRNTIYTGLIALAVSYNLTSGRFDYSVGSILLLSTIASGMIVLHFDLGPIALLVLSLIFGAILGFINGMLYITLKLPPMVLSLGVTMLFEAVAFNISDGNGVRLIGRSDLLVWASGPHIYILILVIVAVLFVLLNYTKFGYHTGALRSGQEIAVNVGINEKKNAVCCYVIAGVCLAAAGTIDMSVIGTVTPNLGLASSAYIQNAFMPMFIGNLLAKHFDRNVGVISGALTQSILLAGISKLGIPSAWQSVVQGVVVLCFFAYSYNSYKIVEFQMFKKKKAEAETLWATRTVR